MGRLQSTVKPNVLENLNNGIWYYNYNITIENQIEFENGEVLDNYSFTQVRINGEPTISKCYEAILKEFNLESDEEILYNIKVDFGELSELESEKYKMIHKIDKYDNSEEVNSFYLNNNKFWLDKATRVGLMNSLTIEKDLNKEISTLWFNNIKLEINIDNAISMLKSLEIYALECYNTTAEHKKNILNSDDIDYIKNYNYKTNYPTKITLVLP